MEDDPVSQFLEPIKKSGISRFGATKSSELRAPIFGSEAAAVIPSAMHFRRRIGFVSAHNILFLSAASKQLCSRRIGKRAGTGDGYPAPASFFGRRGSNARLDRVRADSSRR